MQYEQPQEIQYTEPKEIGYDGNKFGITPERRAMFFKIFIILMIALVLFLFWGYAFKNLRSDKPSFVQDNDAELVENEVIYEDEIVEPEQQPEKDSYAGLGTGALPVANPIYIDEREVLINGNNLYYKDTGELVTNYKNLTAEPEPVSTTPEAIAPTEEEIVVDVQIQEGDQVINEEIVIDQPLQQEIPTEIPVQDFGNTQEPEVIEGEPLQEIDTEYGMPIGE